MARTIKPENVAAKRKEILDATHRLLFTKGYEEMSIQDVINEVQISSGAFHHYFSSRNALLEALIQKIQEESEKPLLPIVHDPHLSALEKLKGFFNTFDQKRMEHEAEIARLGLVWYTDSNAVVRLRVAEAVIQQRAPLLNAIVRQGIQEGVFTIPYPEQAGEIILALVQGMGDAHARLLFAAAREGAAASPESITEIVQNIVTTHWAYMDAIERALGAPANCLYRADIEIARFWVDAIRKSE